MHEYLSWNDPRGHRRGPPRTRLRLDQTNVEGGRDQVGEPLAAGSQKPVRDDMALGRRVALCLLWPLLWIRWSWVLRRWGGRRGCLGSCRPSNTGVGPDVRRAACWGGGGQAWGHEGRRKKGRQGTVASQEMSVGWHQAFLS